MKKLLCALICALTIFSLTACSVSNVEDEAPSDTTAETLASTPTQPYDQPTVPYDEDATSITGILSFVDKFNEAANDAVRITQPTVVKQDDGSYTVSGTNGISLVVRLDPKGNVVLVSSVSEDIPEKLSIAKTVMLLLQGKTLLPEEKQAIIDNTKATIDAISAEIDAAWENAQETELDTNLPDYSSLKAEATQISEEIQKVKDAIAGG